MPQQWMDHYPTDRYSSWCAWACHPLGEAAIYLGKYPPSHRGVSATVDPTLHERGYSSITDFYPDSHVLISNLASFLIRFHKQPDCKLQMETSGNLSISNRYPSLRDTWVATRSKFSRVSQRSIRNLTNQQLQRHWVMLLYGLFLLQFGHVDPQPPLSLDDVQHRVRLLFDRGIAA